LAKQGCGFFTGGNVEGEDEIARHEIGAINARD
jgi:hypothetical protein